MKKSTIIAKVFKEIESAFVREGEVVGKMLHNELRDAGVSGGDILEAIEEYLVSNGQSFAFFLASKIEDSFKRATVGVSLA